MPHTIIVSAYLNEHKLRYFERLDRYLRQYQVQLVLLNQSGAEVKTTCEHLSLPSDVAACNTSEVPLVEDGELTGELAYAAAMEAVLHEVEFSRAASAIRRYTSFIREIFLRRRPCLCVLWTQFTGLHRAAVSVCLELNIPYVFAHLGILPGTIVFEHGGQMAESWVVKDNETFMSQQVGEEDLVKVRNYLEYVRREKRTRKRQTTDFSIKSTIKKIREKDRRIVFYAGQNDPGSGMWPSYLPEARVHSPIFFHTLEALQYLSLLAEENNWQILFKPHPHIEDRHKDFQGLHPSRVDFVVGANVFECIYESDVTVTILSQTSYLSLVHKKPVVLLGRNQLSGKGCVYEVSSRDEVAEKISQALRDGRTEAQRKYWLRHVAQLCKYYLFSFDDDIIPLIGRDVGDAACYLMSKAQFPEPLFGRADPEGQKSWLMRKSPLGYLVNRLRRVLPQELYSYLREYYQRLR